ncbi:hypothetical protein ACIQKB_36975 [Streptomyces sp. NPDC092046]|uniref:hypothetical protein n=1 Tax=Streptomyces sp. NPDC092046 TaxID=3366009 RepID=UPI0037FABBB6
MTSPAPARRSLGTGPATPPVRAQEADLHGLPHIELPDPDGLRERGVLGPRPAQVPRARRTLGGGAGAAETAADTTG